MYCLVTDRGSRLSLRERGVMTLETLAETSHITGVKQVTKAVSKGKASCVFVANDADDRVIRSLKELCVENGVELVDTATMAELGKACSIDVGSAAAAALNETR